MPFVNLNRDELQKPLRKLSKLLKNFPRKPSPDLVHDLRTRTRRVEANLKALRLDEDADGKRLLKNLRPVRRKAGKVRDMDVLSGLAADLHGNSDESCELVLIEHLGWERQQRSRQLYKTVQKRQSQIRELLKETVKLADANLDPSGKPTRKAESWPADLVAEFLQIEHELRAWPRLNAGNLDPFRLKVKELRNVLKLDKNADPEFIEQLGHVKDEIGEWHDWGELSAIAEKLLDHGPECALLKLIRANTRKKFSEAMAMAEKMRRRYLRASDPQALPHAA